MSSFDFSGQSVLFVTKKQPTLPLNIVIYSTPLMVFLKGFCTELSAAKKSSESQLWDQPEQKC